MSGLVQALERTIADLSSTGSGWALVGGPPDSGPLGAIVDLLFATSGIEPDLTDPSATTTRNSWREAVPTPVSSKRPYSRFRWALISDEQRDAG